MDVEHDPKLYNRAHPLIHGVPEKGELKINGTFDEAMKVFFIKPKGNKKDEASK